MDRISCIIAAGIWDGKRALLKNRDRNYTPAVTLVRDVIDGCEVVYMRDDVTGWCEGMNEHGIGITNAALAVGIDEAEGKLVKVTGKTTRDGKRILKALACDNLEDAVESVCEYMNGLKGHTFIATPDKVVCIEQTREHECRVKELNPEDLHVRTNHGHYHTDAGYTEGEDYVSSVIRREKALLTLRDLESPMDLGPGLMKGRMKDRNDPNNMVRDTNNMSTTSQMVMNLTDREACFYVIPGKMDYEGVEDNLPDGYSPKIKIKVFSYRNGGKELVELSLKTGLRRKSVDPVKLASRYLQADVPEKYKHIDFKPPQSVADEAEKGLEYRQKASPSNRGGLTPAEAAKQGIGSGVQRAVNLKNRNNISPDVIKQMTAFFSRHEKNKGVAPEHKGEPWNDKGNVAWLIWGGDPGRAWAEKVKKQMEAADEKAKKTAARLPMGPRPASPSQISYAKVLIEQGIRGLKGIPGWLKPGDAPTDAQLATMDSVSISTLIDSLKSRKPFEVERYGNGAYKIVRKADLSPPLGINGGPCKVVDRINRAIRNPALRESLIDDAETGDLSNPDARKVYPLTTESGSGFKSFTILPHAQFRMDYRTITVKDVEGALNSFLDYARGVQKANPGGYESLLAQDKIEWVDPKTRLKVVFATDAGRIEIVTVFWKGRQDPPSAICTPMKRANHDLEEITPVTEYQSPLQVIEAELVVLESLWSDVQAVGDTYASVVPMPHVGRIAGADLALHSQTELFAKCEHAMRHAERVINMCRTQLQLNPGDPKVSSFLRDAQMLYDRFAAGRASAREILSAINQKIVPTALKGIVAEAVDAVKAVTRYPNSVTVKVNSRMAPVALNNGVVSAQVFDAYVTVYPLPKDESPAHQQFVFTQCTLGDTNVYLTVIDRTNGKAPAKPVKVTGGASVAKKILTALKGWSGLI